MQAGGNPYAQLKARYEIVLSYNTYDVSITNKSSVLQNNDKDFKKYFVKKLKKLSNQNHNLLIKDRAKTLLALVLLDKTVTDNDIEEVRKDLDKAYGMLADVIKSQRSPTKTAMARVLMPRLYSPIPFPMLNAEATTSIATDASTTSEAENTDNRAGCHSPFSDYSDEESNIRQMRRDYF